MVTRAEKHENTRAVHHPRRTLEQSRKLADAGWFPFIELSDAENDIIFCARLAGYGSCFPAYPNATSQAMRTLAGANAFLEHRHHRSMIQ